MISFCNTARIGVLLGTLCLVAMQPTAVMAQDTIDYTIKTVADDWNSLEVVKLVVGLLIPAAMLFTGVWLDRRIKEFEHRQWSNQKVIEKRLEVYEKITPRLNEMMCYFMRIGTWKEHDPTEIVDMKRDLDKIAHIYAPLFSPQFMEMYNAFIGQCFATFRGDGKDAQLRTDCVHYRDAFVGNEDDNAGWQNDWDEYFTGPEEASDRKAVAKAYHDLVGFTAQELGVGLSAESVRK